MKLDVIPVQAPAEKQPGKSAPDDRATEFRAVEGAQEQYSGATLLVEAYAAIWLILMAWLVLLWRKQASMNTRLDGLEKAIDRGAAKLEARRKAEAG